jgi:methyl-accepting chemotaxis protein
MEALTHSQIEINASIREIVKGQHEIRERVATVESSSKSAHHRLDSIEELTKSIHEMSYAVKSMSSQFADVLSLIKDHDGRIEVIERQPGTLAIKGWTFIGGIVLAAMIGALLGKVGL